MLFIDAARRLVKRVGRVAVVLGVAAGAVGVTVAFAGTTAVGPVWVGPKEAYPMGGNYITGVYAAENSCYCHTVGAGRLGRLDDISWAIGSSYRSYPSGPWDAGVIVNGTGSLTLSMRGHQNW